MQKTDFQYHIRGSLLGINLDGNANAMPNSNENDLYSFKLDHGFDGNILGQSWRSSANNENRAYAYSYYISNRLSSAAYSPSGNFSLSNITHDKNGNIKTLKRNGNGNELDALTYSYSGNRLTRVTDTHGTTTANEFVHKGNGSGDLNYNVDGSLSTDDNENISSITYDQFHKKPTVINFGDGSFIKKFYDGNGAVLRTEYSNGEIWDFAGGLVYKNDLPFSMETAEGRAVYNTTTSKWDYEYFYKDHQNNIRSTFGVENNQLTEKSRQDYDPWGVETSGFTASGTSENNFKWLNREKQKGTAWYQLGERMYSSVLGRFAAVDSKADHPTQVGLSPYAYSKNSPVLNSDPNGDICLPCAIVIGVMLLTNSQPANAPRGGSNAMADHKAYQTAQSNYNTNVVTSLFPAAGAEAKVSMVLSATAKREVGKVASGQVQKTLNKNSNEATGNFVLYEVKDKAGTPLKVGKADAARTNSEGVPVRVNASERSAQKTHPEAKAEVISGSQRTTTTGQMKEYVAKTVRNKRAEGNELPLNRERDKRYNNN